MPITGPDILLYEKHDKVVVITLNRPERMNALSCELQERLEEAWIRFHDDEDAWVAILTGAGEKAFCSGIDLIERNEMTKKGVGRGRRPEYFGAEIWKPKIAAINGYAVGAGFLLALDCDIKIAAEHSELGIPETKWNMPAYWVCILSRNFTLSHALELALWGDKRITAKRGYEMGFINKVVPREQLMEEAMSWASRMTLLAPRAVRNLKEIIYRTYAMTYQEGLAFGKILEQNLIGMEDSIEGPRAFIEKRKPLFKNK
ncbi:enoyl-CoA hydratase-related protein [Chloroflexota bacterium]